MDISYGSAEEYERHDEHGRIEHIMVFIALCEEPLLWVQCLGHDLFVKLVSSAIPFVASRTWEGALFCKANT